MSRPNGPAVELDGDLTFEGPSGTIRLRQSESGPVLDSSSFAAFLALRRLKPPSTPSGVQIAPTLLARKGVAFARVEGPLKVSLQWPKRVLPETP